MGLDGESLKPVGVLRIAAAKCKNCIGKPILPVAERANADHHGAIAPLLKRELIVGKRCRFVRGLHCSAITKEDACSGDAEKAGKPRSSGTDRFGVCQESSRDANKRGGHDLSLRALRWTRLVGFSGCAETPGQEAAAATAEF